MGPWGRRWNRNPPEHVPVLRGWLKFGAVPEKDSRLGVWQGRGGGRSYKKRPQITHMWDFMMHWNREITEYNQIISGLNSYIITWSLVYEHSPASLCTAQSPKPMWNFVYVCSPFYGLFKQPKMSQILQNVQTIIKYISSLFKIKTHRRLYCLEICRRLAMHHSPQIANKSVTHHLYLSFHVPLTGRWEKAGRPVRKNQSFQSLSGGKWSYGVGRGLWCMFPAWGWRRWTLRPPVILQYKISCVEHL